MANTVIVKVSTADDEVFREVDEDVLRDMAGRSDGADDAALAALGEEFWSSSREARVYRSSEASYGLCLDGSLDAESWAEVVEALDES